MAEEHDDHKHECVHGCRLWQVGPFHFHGVPLEYIGTAEECKCGNERKEPLGIKESLHFVPIAMDEVAHHKKMHKLQSLEER